MNFLKLKIEDLIIYLEKMIKEMKNIYNKFYKKNKNILKKYFLKNINNKFQKNQIYFKNIIYLLLI